MIEKKFLGGEKRREKEALFPAPSKGSKIHILTLKKFFVGESFN